MGGVIRDWNGNIVRSFLGLIDSLDANETELFAILIGCREFLRMGGYSATLEGDSFASNLAVFRKFFSSLEIDGLGGGDVGYFRRLGASFHHIHREANAVADSLARARVSRSSIPFDV
ncbi:hypothetical protein AAC387_Pa05g0650 [Persea americana]